uniref:Ig-like domain-containing protein n=1 Tax=Timema monikensis TaxID=170555 RepID=A0A7R9EEM6_9NEOP|nr:unnamed protein product [Timema monikensis]
MLQFGCLVRGLQAILECVIVNHSRFQEVSSNILRSDVSHFCNKGSRDKDSDVFMEHTINFYPNSLISGPDHYSTVLCNLSRPLYEKAGFKSRRGWFLWLDSRWSSICYYSMEPCWWSRGLVRPSNVAWVRVDTQTILSIHHNVITQNPRISLSYNDHRSWYLHIKNVHETDRGWYMCQVNTDPMRSRQGYLQVVGEEILLCVSSGGVVADTTILLALWK